MRRNGKPRNHSPPNAPKEFAEGQRNLHIHVLLTMRPLTENGEWGAKQKKIYDLDENGEKIPVIEKRQDSRKLISKTVNNGNATNVQLEIAVH